MNFDLWMLLGGIGIFLFGIYLMEESLKAISGKAFKTFIRRYTSTPLKSIASGAFATAILQSSSAVSLMVLAFVGAGIMALTNAFGVILGTNLGTTFTSWIVATIGFKFSIEAFALPFIGLGGLGLIFFGRSSKKSNISKLMVGFGFLFLGLDYMKTSVEELAATFDLSAFQDYNILVFVLIGFVITAIMQSSSAAMAIVLTAVYGELIDFYTATGMVIGTNVGTTATVLLGSVGGTVAKKQVALGHIIFNFATGIAALLLLRPLNFLVLDVAGLQGDPLLALALFHTVFNALGVALFLPFIPWVAALLAKAIEDKTVHASQYLHLAASEVPEAALEAIKNETAHLLRLVMAHHLHRFGRSIREVLPAEYASAPQNPDKLYPLIKAIQSEVFLFAAKLQNEELEEAEADQLFKLLEAVRYGAASAKTLKDVAHELEYLDQSDLPALRQQHQGFSQDLLHFCSSLENLLSHSAEQGQPTAAAQELDEREEKAMQALSGAIATPGIRPGDVSSLLAASRSFSLALQQLSQAAEDWIVARE
jgi:phosphate:Na+ symporter